LEGRPRGVKHRLELVRAQHELVLDFESKMKYLDHFIPGTHPDALTNTPGVETMN
jgi:hypothetical protein